MGTDGTNKAVVASGLEQWDKMVPTGYKRMVQDCRKVTGLQGKSKTTRSGWDQQDRMESMGWNSQMG